MLAASSTARTVSTIARGRNRISRCSSEKGTVLNAVITKAVLMTATTPGSWGAWKKRPSGIAAAQETAKLPTPTSTARPLSWATCSSAKSRSVITVDPRPNSLTRVISPSSASSDALPCDFA